MKISSSMTIKRFCGRFQLYCLFFQSNDVVVRRDGDDELIIDDDKRLCDYKIVNGTEIAFFKRDDYEIYKQNPELVMD